jgi:hypothetical protein
MAHGLQVFNAAGSLRLDVSDRLTRLMYSAVVAATASGSATVAGITTANAVPIAMCVDAAGNYKCPHEVWITDNTIHWAAMPAPGGGSTDVRESSLILVFRHK